MTSLVMAWSQGRDVALRRGAVRDVMRVSQTARSYFKGGAYWQKRFLELLVLSKAGERTPMDLDNAFDMFPVANGTKAGVQKIWPDANSQDELRECIRALQRTLGAGQRRVPLVTISALLCFWRRALDRTAPWPAEAWYE